MNVKHMAEIRAKLESAFREQFGPDEPEQEEPHFPINQDDEE